MCVSMFHLHINVLVLVLVLVLMLVLCMPWYALVCLRTCPCTLAHVHDAQEYLCDYDIFLCSTFDRAMRYTVRPHDRGSARQGMQSRVLELRSTVPVESLLYSCLFG